MNKQNRNRLTDTEEIDGCYRRGEQGGGWKKK